MPSSRWSSTERLHERRASSGRPVMACNMDRVHSILPSVSFEAPDRSSRSGSRAIASSAGIGPMVMTLIRTPSRNTMPRRSPAARAWSTARSSACSASLERPNQYWKRPMFSHASPSARCSPATSSSGSIEWSSPRRVSNGVVDSRGLRAIFRIATRDSVRRSPAARADAAASSSRAAASFGRPESPSARERSTSNPARAGESAGTRSSARDRRLRAAGTSLRSSAARPDLASSQLALSPSVRDRSSAGPSSETYRWARSR